MKEKHPKRMGRPPKAPEEKLSYRVTVRLTSAQYEELLGRAKNAGLSLSAYVAEHIC